MGCPKLHEGWVFLRGGEKHLLFPRFPREKNRSRSAPAEMDDECPFLFSSEYLDSETGLVYYNYRYYSPELGRWLTKEPLEEWGSENLYSFVSNAPLFFWDYLGLSPGDFKKMLLKVASGGASAGVIPITVSLVYLVVSKEEKSATGCTDSTSGGKCMECTIGVKLIVRVKGKPKVMDWQSSDANKEIATMENALWAKIKARITEHEEGHMLIAVGFLKATNGKIFKETVKSCTNACKKAQAKAEKAAIDFFNARYDIYLASQRSYDKFEAIRLKYFYGKIAKEYCEKYSQIQLDSY